MISEQAINSRNDARVHDARLTRHSARYVIASLAVKTELLHLMHQAPCSKKSVVRNQCRGVFEKVCMTYAVKRIDAKSNADQEFSFGTFDGIGSE